jgi:peroxiredoxin
MTYLYVAFAASLIILGWSFYQLALQNGRLTLRLERVEHVLQQSGELMQTPEDVGITGLNPGSLLRDFDLPLLGGGSMTLSQWAGRRVLIAFIHPDCQPSRAFVSKLSLQRADLDPTVVLVSAGSLLKNQQMAAEFKVTCPILLQEDDELSSLYQVRGTPAGYVVDANGRTERPLLIGGDGLLAAMGVLSGVVIDSQPKTTKSLDRSRLLRTGLNAGSTAPEFTLPSIDGSEVTLRSLLAKRVLLVFSDPDCAPCQVLAPKLEKIHRRARDLHVVMISRGDRDSNHVKRVEHQLTFPILLQRQWEISKAYGMFATPIGYLVGRDGVLTHDVAVGEEAILRLANL